MPSEPNSLQDDIRRLCEYVKDGWHNKHGRCSYDDYGHGSSGMALKPCNIHRKHLPEENWCPECRQSPTVYSVLDGLSAVALHERTALGKRPGETNAE